MTTREKICTLAMLVLVLATITPAFAGERQSQGDARWTGPLETANPNNIPQNHFYGETYFVVEQDHGFYDSNSNLVKSGTGLTNEYQSVTLFQYGITNKFNLALLPVFYGDQGGTAVYRTNSDGTTTLTNPSSSGMQVGNLQVRTPYQIYKYKEGKWMPSFTVAPGFLAPTGTGDTNVWTPWFGLWFQRPFWMPGGRILRVRANQNFYFPLQDQTKNNICGGVGTSCKYNQGQYQKTLIGMEYSLTKKWVPAWDFYWKYGDRSSIRAANGTPIAVGNSFNRLAVDPALEYNFTDNVGIIFGAEITVAGRNSGSYIAPQIALQWFK